MEGRIRDARDSDWTGGLAGENLIMIPRVIPDSWCCDSNPFFGYSTLALTTLTLGMTGGLPK